MENVALKGRGGTDVQHKNWKGKILRIWIPIIRHRCSGTEVLPSSFLAATFGHYLSGGGGGRGYFLIGG